jgi:hypothetical protein
MLHCLLLLSPFQSALVCCIVFSCSLRSSLRSYVALSFVALSVPVCTRMLHCLLLLSHFQSALVCCTVFYCSLHSSLHSYIALSFAPLSVPICTRILQCLLLLSPFQHVSSNIQCMLAAIWDSFGLACGIPNPTKLNISCSWANGHLVPSYKKKGTLTQSIDFAIHGRTRHVDYSRPYSVKFRRAVWLLISLYMAQLVTLTTVAPTV